MEQSIEYGTIKKEEIKVTVNRRRAYTEWITTVEVKMPDEGLEVQESYQYAYNEEKMLQKRLDDLKLAIEYIINNTHDKDALRIGKKELLKLLAVLLAIENHQA